MVAHEASAREPVNGQLMHGFRHPFQTGALREGTPRRVGNFFARVVVDLGIDLHIIAQKDGWLAFPQCRSHTSKAQHLAVMPRFFSQFSDRRSLWTFAGIYPAFGESPLPLVRTSRFLDEKNFLLSNDPCGHTQITKQAGHHTISFQPSISNAV